MGTLVGDFTPAYALLPEAALAKLANFAPDTRAVYLIRDPDIPLSQVEAFQNDVIVLLENNGRMPEPVLPETPTETAPDEAEIPAAENPEASAEAAPAAGEPPSPAGDAEPDSAD